jgi:hypothetical protein
MDLDAGSAVKCEHKWALVYTRPSKGFGDLKCEICGAEAPYPTCHTPDKCWAAGTCKADYCCFG